jgi:UDP-3-O-[3-hydroxymyristoyl] N-acetylglucosamine deacetylase / 3-hydroxyacyl-[acyl-carrier-protein] dehydratase
MSTETKKREAPIAPAYDPNVAPIKNHKEVAELLPHRYPFLLVDKIIEMTDTYIVGIKNVTINEPFFPGHFPGNPVMPGVLQLEALAQCGGVLCILLQEPGLLFDTYFLKIDNAKFKAMVVPGDTLIMKMELNGPIRRGICEMRATAFVGNKLVCEADMVAQIVKKS